MKHTSLTQSSYVPFTLQIIALNKLILLKYLLVSAIFLLMGGEKEAKD